MTHFDHSDPEGDSVPVLSTWQQCAEAGMSLTQAALHLGKSVSSGSAFAKRHGFQFRPGYERRRERMKALNADPEFNPLAALSQIERADYDILRKKGGLSRAAALKAIGREDLMGQKS